MLVRPVMKRLFFPWKIMEKKARFARAPHFYTSSSSKIFSQGGNAWNLFDFDNQSAAIVRVYTINIIPFQAFQAL